MLQTHWSPSVRGCAGNSAFTAVQPQPPNCGIWVAFIAASKTFIVL
ncbi:vacuolar protein sorting-associated protein, partial [Trifolium medium]|nr:vacuolar protein sorting-associated protein [Trifolium medium]